MVYRRKVRRSANCRPFHDGQSFFSRDILTDPNSALLPLPEAAAYLGMLGFLAAPFGFLYASCRHRLFLVTIIVVAIGAAFSIQPVRRVFDHLPVIKALKNGRLILVAGFGIVTLSGLGISRYSGENPSSISSGGRAIRRHFELQKPVLPSPRTPA